MKLLLPLVTLLGLLLGFQQASAEVKNVRACANISRTVTMLQQDLGNGISRVVVQTGRFEVTSYTSCEYSEDNHFIVLSNCQGKETTAHAKFILNKETYGATLTTKSFFAKNFALACQDITL